jgi:hypothetical protein
VREGGPLADFSNLRMYGYVARNVDLDQRSVMFFSSDRKFAGGRRRAAERDHPSCCFATERGIEVCAPVHDAILICALLDRLDEDVARMRAIMAEASRIVLSGFELRTEAKVVCYPNRFMDKRGVVMWKRVSELIERRTAVMV